MEVLLALIQWLDDYTNIKLSTSKECIDELLNSHSCLPISLTLAGSGSRSPFVVPPISFSEQQCLPRRDLSTNLGVTTVCVCGHS